MPAAAAPEVVEVYERADGAVEIAVAKLHGGVLPLMVNRPGLLARMALSAAAAPPGRTATCPAGRAPSSVPYPLRHVAVTQQC